MFKGLVRSSPISQQSSTQQKKTNEKMKIGGRKGVKNEIQKRKAKVEGG